MDEATIAQVPAHTRAGLIAMNADKPLAKLGEDERKELAHNILQRYMDGSEIAELAAELGVSPARVYQVLIDTDADGWRSAQSSKALVEFQQSLKAIRYASDGLELARAREEHKSAQWQLEKLLRRLYGEEKPNININLSRTISVQDALDEAQARLSMGNVVATLEATQDK